jgi:hypothetical protein
MMDLARLALTLSLSENRLSTAWSEPEATSLVEAQLSIFSSGAVMERCGSLTLTHLDLHSMFTHLLIGLSHSYTQKISGLIDSDGKKA